MENILQHGFIALALPKMLRIRSTNSPSAPRAKTLSVTGEKTMICISTYSRLFKSIAITILVAGLTAAQAQTPAGQKRPATVPKDYAITPFGYFHPSCISHLVKGDAVHKDEAAIRHANGTSDNIPVCAYPHYKADGEKVIGDERAVTGNERVANHLGKQPTINGWVESASTSTNSSYGYLYASWSVPPAPSTNDGQVVFFFPGLEDYNDSVTILQPVLGWNSDYASAWGIASWNCCASGTVFEAAPTPVNSGDTIVGYMYPTCDSGTQSCSSWDIVTLDLTSGNFSALLNTSSQGQTFNWAFGGVLEAYGIEQCGDYPSSGDISFGDLVLADYNFYGVNPSWSVNGPSSGATPQCGYGGSLPQEVTLNF
jgi:hypothetical protein